MKVHRNYLKTMSQKEFNDTTLTFLNFSEGGDFFIDLIYLNSGEQKKLMVLPFDQIKKGVNIL